MNPATKATKQTAKTLYASAILSGAVLAYLSARVLLQGSWLNLIPWAVAGLIVGTFCATRKQALVAGGLFGFVLTACFMIFGFQGTSSQVPGLTFFTTILAVIGAGCGMMLTLIGRWAKARTQRAK